MLAAIQLIDFLEKVYAWDEGIIDVAGIVISTVFLFVAVPTKKIGKILLAILPVTFTFLISFGIQFVKKNYTYVPSINFTEESLANVHLQLDQAGLWYSDDHLTVDKRSMSYLKNGEDLTNSSLRVTDCNPKPGEFVKKETIVELSVRWFDEIAIINLKDSLMKDFDAKEFYGDPDLSTLETYNTFSIRICPQPVALKEIVADAEDFITTFPSLAEESIVEIELMDYTTNEVVDKAICYLGDEITFPSIQKGEYYFTVFCNGYTTLQVFD